MSPPCVKTSRIRHHVALVSVVILGAACGDGGTGPSSGPPGVRIVAGAGATDTVLTQPAQALIAEVRDTRGKVVPGVIVRFQSRPPSDTARQFYEAAIFVCQLTASSCFNSQFVADTTDRSGRVKALVRLGSVAGKAVVLVTVPELGVQDSATFTVTPGAPVKLNLSTRDTTLDIAGAATLRGHAADQFGNTRSEVAAFSAGPGGAVTVDAATSTVTGRDLGTQWVYAHVGGLTDSAIVRVVPAGRLVVWSASQSLVRLVDTDGKAERTIFTNAASDIGVFPTFDPTRQRITLHTGAPNTGVATDAIVLDTTGTPRRDISGFSNIVAVRETDDGNVMVVGRRTTDPQGTYLFRVTADNTITLLTMLNLSNGSYGGADITHDGSRVAHLNGSVLSVLDVSTGITTQLDDGARSPRWSVQGDRLVYLRAWCTSGFDGIPIVVNADGSGSRILSNFCFSPGLAWSPDGSYIVGRNSNYEYAEIGLRIMRVSDGASVVAHFFSGGLPMDYYQPDWR